MHNNYINILNNYIKMLEIPVEQFQTYYDDPNITDIYITGDLHGDFLNLIILLRDCACVISKKNHDKNKIDEEVIKYLKYDNFDNIVGNTEEYDQLMGYEWIGNNKYVVFVGDLIDNYRLTIPDIHDKTRTHYEYPYEELKIYLFINALNKQIRTIPEKSGKIIKLVGNHELMNMNGQSFRHYSKYTMKNKFEYGYDLNKKKKLNRNEYFLSGNPGVKVLFDEGGIGVVAKIKDFICVHGGPCSELLGENFEILSGNNYTFEKINKYLKEFMFTGKNDPKYELIINNSVNQKTSGGLLWCRRFGAFNEQNDVYRMKRLCDELYKFFRTICNDEPLCSNNTRLIIAHCVQSFNSKKMTSFTKVITNKENNVDIIKVPVFENISSINTGIIHGITVECSRNNNINDPALYRVDVGMSRAFDMEDKFFLNLISQSILSSKTKNKIYLSDKVTIEILNQLIGRSPQLLHIKCLGKHKYETEIIRSNFKNTMINMPRKFLTNAKNKDNNVVNSNIVIDRLFETYDKYFTKESPEKLLGPSDPEYLEEEKQIKQSKQKKIIKIPTRISTTELSISTSGMSTTTLSNNSQTSSLSDLSSSTSNTIYKYKL